MGRKDFYNEEVPVGEARINIAFRYELHLLEMIERYNECFRNRDMIGMADELILLHEGIVDKVGEAGDDGKHEESRKIVVELKNRYSNLKARAYDDDPTDFSSRIARKKLGKVSTELIEFLGVWKRELVKIMSNHGMLVSKQKGIGDSIAI